MGKRWKGQRAIWERAGELGLLCIDMPEEYLAYAASKGRITSLARSVAHSFGKGNIKSLVIAPGFTKTQMAEQFIGQYSKKRILEEISLTGLT